MFCHSQLEESGKLERVELEGLSVERTALNDKIEELNTSKHYV